MVSLVFAIPELVSQYLGCVCRIGHNCDTFRRCVAGNDRLDIMAKMANLSLFVQFCDTFTKHEHAGDMN